VRRAALLALPIIAGIGGALAWAGSQGGVRAGGMPVFALCVALAFAINALAFVPSWLARSERYYDLTGSATYLSIVALALALGPADVRSRLLAAMIGVWAVRLGLFLFARIHASGRDPRFDAIKLDFVRFLMAFMLQGLWVALTAGAALAAMTSTPGPALPAAAESTAAALPALGLSDAIGFLVWLVGFGLEVVADRQKQAFRADPAHGDRFITTGLWARSRHPNYFGEIVLWVGVAWVAFPALEGFRFATLVSPLFVYVLLTRISGIPLLEARARKRWGDDPAYLAYLERTPRLFPRLSSSVR
jgi:steroid 5-alpha reductase family enzyme